jgi:plasmid stabilization system protein ParE
VNLRILAAAETEVVQARDYLEGKATGLGSRFLDDLAETLLAIAEQPLRFQKLETLPEGQPYRRALLAVFRYAVVFEILPDEIVVVAVCHTSREPNYWLARRKT